MPRKLPGLVVILLCSLLTAAQEVHVSSIKGGIVLGVHAQKSYQLMPGQERGAVLSIECLHKGSKVSHLLIFSPGGTVVPDSPDANEKSGQAFTMTIAGTRQETAWVPYVDPETFAYFAKTEPERLQFIQTVLRSGTVAIEFKPFLSGVPTTTSFDVSKLEEEMSRHTECTAAK